MNSPTDDQLMLSVRNGDVRQLGELFDRHHGPLFNFSLRMTGNRDASEDLVQEVFFRILRSRHTYRAGSSFVTWMYQIARNARLDRLRKAGRETELDPEDDRARDAARSPAEQIASEQEAELVRRSLALLPQDKREVLVLSRFQNLQYEQIGEILGCETGTVKVRVYRALRELREIYCELAREKRS